jgi:hypothetical protein
MAATLRSKQKRRCPVTLMSRGLGRLELGTRLAEILQKMSVASTFPSQDDCPQSADNKFGDGCDGDDLKSRAKGGAQVTARSSKGTCEGDLAHVLGRSSHSSIAMSSALAASGRPHLGWQEEVNIHACNAIGGTFNHFCICLFNLNLLFAKGLSIVGGQIWAS